MGERRHPDDFRTVVEVAPFPMVVGRICDNSVLYANRLFAETVGVSWEDRVGRRVPDLLCDPGDRQSLVDAIGRDGPVANREVRLRRPDGAPSTSP